MRPDGVAAGTPKFEPAAGFQAELKSRVEEYFERMKRSPRGGARLVAKTAAIAGWAIGSYVLLVFFAATWWQTALLAVSLALAIAAIGFNIQHDGNHGAFSERRWVNRLMALSLDAIGGSSYIWSFKHNILHHSYTNLDGADKDIDLGALGRLSPAQRCLWFHRYQHYYLWALYSMLAIKWQFVDDFARLTMGRVGGQPFPRPRGWQLATLFGGKAFVFIVAFLVPALRHPLWLVIAVYAATMLMVGFLLAVIFQLAHSVGEAAHPVLPEGSLRVPTEWAVHQVQTTVDFARRNRLLTWFIGGLNFQVEHHLFPRISHVHYPAISRIVEEISARFGVRYAAHRSLLPAIASHFRFLREMGRPAAGLV